ncbi:MAG: hypothetical protein JO001_10490 [Alphaproteobacteria bacterium]|nr:hypothetical protein [Alphaproteobacteria bacterium]
MDDHDKEESQRRLGASVAEMKAGIARLLEPHLLPGSGGVITLALIELGVERHLRICPTEKSARDLVNGVVTKVLKSRNTD